MRIPFNVPTLLGREREYIEEVLELKRISGNGKFTGLCQDYLGRLMGGSPALLTTSCSSALEMSALLASIKSGDEVILPSFTFPSTANAIVSRGGIPVFVDIRPDTLNIDEQLIEAAVTPQTKAIIVVHYGGVACEMDQICAIAQEHGLLLIEDAAHALHAAYRDRPIGSLGDVATFSFHESKNIVSGEGGALIINNTGLLARAEIIWKHGTNRLEFDRGKVDFYNWIDLGSSFPPSEITAAFLYAQLEHSHEATLWRLALWRNYARELQPLEKAEKLYLPHPPDHCLHNGHIFYLLAPSAGKRTEWLERLEQCNVNAVSHYVPLHSAPAGRRFGRTAGSLPVTEDIAGRILRLPLHFALSERDQSRVVDAVRQVVTG